MARLGVSVYPDTRPLEEIEGYLRRAASFGYTRVFSSMFSVEDTPEQVLLLFKRLIASAHKLGMEVSLDVNPSCMKRLGAIPYDLSVFHGIGVDILRMDGAYGEDDNVAMLKNEYGIRIEYNASALMPEAIASCARRGVEMSRMLACHNFYPQRYTGFRWDRFLQVNDRLAQLGIAIGAFVASHAKESHGVWDPPCGLPTVERMRDLAPELQARLLVAAGTTDIFFGNAYATDEELVSVADAVVPVTPTYLGEEHERMVKHSEYLDYDRLMNSVCRIRVNVAPEATETEREILFGFFPHVDMGDSSEWIWRSRAPRMFYQDRAITPRSCEGTHFMPGDVVIVNDSYKHYAGEVQVVIEAIANDGERNLIGRIAPEEMAMFDAIKDGQAVVFIP